MWKLSIYVKSLDWKTIKEVCLQYQGFARGHPPHYWPGPTELNFPERTRGGAFIGGMTEDIKVGICNSYKGYSWLHWELNISTRLLISIDKFKLKIHHRVQLQCTVLYMYTCMVEIKFKVAIYIVTDHETEI